jgi:polyribonucleotide nucleotidyltransferase
VKRVANPADVVKVGDVFDVKITSKDDQGRFKLSRKVLMPGGEGSDGGGEERRPPRREHGESRPHGDHHRGPRERH